MPKLRWAAASVSSMATAVRKCAAASSNFDCFCRTLPRKNWASSSDGQSSTARCRGVRFVEPFFVYVRSPQSRQGIRVLFSRSDVVSKQADAVMPVASLYESNRSISDEDQARNRRNDCGCIRNCVASEAASQAIAT